MAPIIVLAVLFARNFVGGQWTQSPWQSRSTALDILNERYTKGEINNQEYEQRKKTLTQ